MEIRIKTRTKVLKNLLSGLPWFIAVFLRNSSFKKLFDGA